jgi:hypothetical protein
LLSKLICMQLDLDPGGKSFADPCGSGSETLYPDMSLVKKIDRKEALSREKTRRVARHIFQCVSILQILKKSSSLICFEFDHFTHKKNLTTIRNSTNYAPAHQPMNHTYFNPISNSCDRLFYIPLGMNKCPKYPVKFAFP